MQAMKAALIGTALALVFVPLAAAKNFAPGDLQVCASSHCVPITNQNALHRLSAFYYGKASPTRVKAPSSSAPYVELRFRHGYLTGIAAGVGFDRFLSFGVNLDQFAARTWYAIPAPAAAEIRRIAANMRAQPLPLEILARSH
jgi:hypothetical protein